MKRVWIFASMRRFNESEKEEIRLELKDFIAQWKAHGTPLKSEVTILEERFIKVDVDEGQAEASGCSIDSLTKKIQQLEQKFNLTLMNRMLIFYKENGEVKFLTFNDFKSQIKSGELSKIQVYNTGVANENQFKESWLLPLQDSWAAKFV